MLSEEYRKKQLPKAVNLKYEEVDPELLAAMDAIDEEDWENDSQNEEGYILDDFIQQAIEDKGADDFDFDAHIRNLLRQREEREKSHVALTEDRYAAEIQREEGDQHDDGTQHDDRPIDRQFDIVRFIDWIDGRFSVSTTKKMTTRNMVASRFMMPCSKWFFSFCVRIGCAG